MRLVLCGSVALSCLSVAWAAVSPTTAQPIAVLAVQPENQALVDQAAKVYEQARVLTVELNSKREQKQYAAIRGETVGEAYALLLQVARLAARLKLAVEPAGVDLELRQQELHGQVNAVITEMRQNPAVREGLAKSYVAKVLPLVTKRTQQIPALEKLCKANQWEKAEDELYEILDELEKYGCWYEAQDRKNIFEPFFGATKTINDTLIAKRSEEVKKRLEDARTSPGPTLDAWLQQSAAAAASIAQTGQASLEGKQLNGPAAFTNAVRQLLTVQQAALRLRGVEWSRERVYSKQIPELGLLESAFQQKAPETLQRLAGFIDADATRAGATEAEALYPAYLTEIAAASGLFADGTLATAVQPALQRLIAKSPTLTAQAPLYERATADLMRWRKRIATVQANARTKDFPKLADKLNELGRQQAGFAGFLGRAQNLSTAGLTIHAPAIVGQLKKLVGGNVQIGAALGSDSGAHATTGYQDRTVARLPQMRQTLAGYLPLIEYDLLVNPTSPPLSLAAATALSKARRGDLTAAGGTVRQVGLSGLVPRAMHPGPEDLAAIRLGPLPAEVIPDQNASNQVCIECELDPAWVQHDLFFIPLR